MITQIIWLLTWPLLITISWFSIQWILKKAEPKHHPTEMNDAREQ